MPSHKKSLISGDRGCRDKIFKRIYRELPYKRFERPHAAISLRGVVNDMKDEAVENNVPLTDYEAMKAVKAILQQAVVNNDARFIDPKNEWIQVHRGLAQKARDYFTPKTGETQSEAMEFELDLFIEYQL
mgnify:FL=1|tara:strand:- start:181 stop:570 length:390 start_codon:yes stop_codon:yes gene_type:complete